MSKKVGSPHDRFVRRCLGDLELAKAFFRRFLAPDQIKEIDLDDLKPGGKESFVGHNLRALTTDLLFQAPIHHHPGYLSLLVEHKSEGAARGEGHILPFQMRSQEIMIMDYGRRNHPQKRYPLVYMVGLYHGERPYAGPKTVGERIDAPASMIPQRWNETIELIDLSAYTDKELIANGKLGVFLLVLKHIYASDILQTLEFLAPHMEKIQQEQGDDFITTVFRYLLEAIKVEKREPMIHIAIKTFSKEMGEHMLTIADSLREEGKLEGRLEGKREGRLEGKREGRLEGKREGRLEGKREGRLEGKLEGKQEFAKALLADQQPIDFIVKWTGLTPQQIQALAQQDEH